MATETFQFPVDDVGNAEAVVAPISCRSVEIKEFGDPTTDYFVRAPALANAQHRRFAGSATVFRKSGNREFQPSEIVGYIETVSGSVTFSGITDAEAGEA